MRPRYADLIRRLRDPDPHQVDKAFDSILFDREQAVPDLIEGYEKTEQPEDVRYYLVQLLGFSEAPEAIPIVEVALDDPSPLVRAEACRSLVDLRARASVTNLRRRLRDVVPEVRRAAADAVTTLTRH